MKTDECVSFQIGYLKNRCLPETKLYEYEINDGEPESSAGLPNGRPPSSGNAADKDESSTPLISSGRILAKTLQACIKLRFLQLFHVSFLLYQKAGLWQP